MIVLAIVAALLPVTATAGHAAVGDTPPTWSIDAEITVSQVTGSSARLDWPAAHDDVFVAGYRIYDGGGTLIDSTTATSYILTDLAGDTSHTVRVEAYDGAGNESQQLSGLNYGPRLVIPAGDQPHSIDIADLNNDQIPDLAIAVRMDDSASILLGNGNGTFQDAQLYAVGNPPSGNAGPKNLALDYFNNDAYLDIVSANQDDGTAGVILNNGNGTFGSLTQYDTSYGTHDVATGDFNNDGDIDFMTVGWGTDNGTLWLGDGDGTFSDPTEHPSGSSPHGIVAGHFNGGGNLDVATAANGASGAAVLAGNGNGTFAAPVILDGYPGGYAHDIAMGDFNEDGDPDLVIAGENADNLSVFLGGSGTTFSSRTVYDVADEPKGVAVGDLNNDGHDDLIGTSVVGHYPGCPGGNNDPLTFWFGNGSGSFTAGGSVNVGEAPFDAAVADFNGDGWNDLASPTWCDDSVSIFLNLGTGGPIATFTTLAGVPSAPAAPTALAGNGFAEVSWSAPADDGGSAITGYKLEVQNLTTPGTSMKDVGLVTMDTLTGLTNGDSYRVRVRAYNVVGDGAYSAWSASFTPSAGVTVPGAPAAPIAVAGDKQATISWSAPSDTGGSPIMGYKLEVETVGVTDVGMVMSKTTTGLSNGVVYRARVAAYNAVGDGAWSAWSASFTPTGTGMGTFVDDDGSIFETDIEWLAAAGITRGCNPPVNDRFCPDDSVTRGQMAAFLVRALGYTADGGGDLFDDDDTSIFEADIDKLGTAGVTRGCNPPANSNFCPGDVVTRGQMAAFLVRALELTDDGGGNTFVDDNGSIFEADIAKLAAAGITRGCNPPANTSFCPDDPVTRGQMAAFLRRALG